MGNYLDLTKISKLDVVHPRKYNLCEILPKPIIVETNPQEIDNYFKVLLEKEKQHLGCVANLSGV